MCKVIIPLLTILLTIGTAGAFAQNTPAADSPKTPKVAVKPLKVDLLPPMQQMIAKMKKLKATGNPDIDFAAQARLHTQGTQALLNAILSVQSDSALTQAAKTMLAAAETNLVSLANLQKELKPGQRNAAFSKQQKRVIAAMSEKIKQSASNDKLTRNPEANIAILLSDQRQDDINLATSYLQFGKDAELRNFAQQSVEKAKLDLDIIKSLLNTK